MKTSFFDYNKSHKKPEKHSEYFIVGGKKYRIRVVKGNKKNITSIIKNVKKNFVEGNAWKNPLNDWFENNCQKVTVFLKKRSTILKNMTTNSSFYVDNEKEITKIWNAIHRQKKPHLQKKETVHRKSKTPQPNIFHPIPEDESDASPVARPPRLFSPIQDIDTLEKKELETLAEKIHAQGGTFHIDYMAPVGAQITDAQEYLDTIIDSKRLKEECCRLEDIIERQGGQAYEVSPLTPEILQDKERLIDYKISIEEHRKQAEEMVASNPSRRITQGTIDKLIDELDSVEDSINNKGGNIAYTWNPTNTNSLTGLEAFLQNLENDIARHKEYLRSLTTLQTLQKKLEDLENAISNAGGKREGIPNIKNALNSLSAMHTMEDTLHEMISSATSYLDALHQ